MTNFCFLIDQTERVLVTGASGFIGARLVDALLGLGLRRVRCLVRASSDVSRLNAAVENRDAAQRVEIIKGNLLSREDCSAVTEDVAVIFHLAAGAGEKSVPDAFMNSVVTTRNLLDASLEHYCLRRLVNASSFAVYTNTDKRHTRILDETCPIEIHPELREDAYCFAKVKQDELVAEYGRNYGIPYVIVRPGYVYGPDKTAITGRVGIDTFGLFLHLGGSNTIPFTYVDNCAEAIALAGLVKDIDGEVFNVVDDELYSSRRFLRLYKRNVRRFPSLYVPHALSWTLCALWEKYSHWSDGQLPAVFNRRRWHSVWKRTTFSNAKLKARLGWTPKVSMADGLERYFAACRKGAPHA